MLSPLGKRVEGERVGLLSFFGVGWEMKGQGCHLYFSMSSKTDRNIQGLINSNMCFTILTWVILLQYYNFTKLDLQQILNRRTKFNPTFLLVLIERKIMLTNNIIQAWQPFQKINGTVML
jgi:hypothetical protein